MDYQQTFRMLIELMICWNISVMLENKLED